MTLETIDFDKTGYFSPLICDYLAQKDELSPFYHRAPELNSFREQIDEKSSFEADKRETLVKALEQQYSGIQVSGPTSENISSLADANTFTITTGHQLNLFTGPLYFLYKIISVINLCDRLKQTYPDYNFVPVYWMATEDHDFEEINYFRYNGKKFQWQGPGNELQGGAVGRLTTDHLKEVASLFFAELGMGKFPEELRELFNRAYLQHETLTEATRYLANALFSEYGLVIVDGDDAGLKRSFVPYIKEDLLNNVAFREVSNTINKLEALRGNYNIQVNPREINLFYLDTGLRDRIIFDGENYGLAEGDKKWSKAELLKEVDDFPQRFSPNVMLRPLYQEVILPNLAYIGGGGELAYWLELKSFFEVSEVPMPVLMLRDSVLLVRDKQKRKLDKLSITYEQLFLEKHSLINKKVREISDISIDFTPERELLIKQFARLYDLAEKTDKSFFGAVKAQEVKQLKGLDKLEKRLLKAQKRKLADHVERIAEIQNELFPNGSLQERSVNFSEPYAEYGPDFVKTLFQGLDPLDARFKIIIPE